MLLLSMHDSAFLRVYLLLASGLKAEFFFPLDLLQNLVVILLG